MLENYKKGDTLKIPPMPFALQAQDIKGQKAVSGKKLKRGNLWKSNLYLAYLFTFVVGNLIITGIKGESKKVDDNTFKTCVEAINKRLDIIEHRIARIEEVLLKKG